MKYNFKENGWKKVEGAEGKVIENIWCRMSDSTLVIEFVGEEDNLEFYPNGSLNNVPGKKIVELN